MDLPLIYVFASILQFSRKFTDFQISQEDFSSFILSLFEYG